MLPTNAAKAERLVRLSNEIYKLDNFGDEAKCAGLRSRIDAAIRDFFPSQVERWSQISFEPDRARVLFAPETWLKLCEDARSDAFAATQEFLMSVVTAARAAPPGPLTVAEFLRPILLRMFDDSIHASPTANITTHAGRFLEDGISTVEATRALDFLRRRGIVTSGGTGYHLLDGPGKDLRDDPEEFERQFPDRENPSTSNAPSTPEPKGESTMDGIRIFISHSSKDEGLASALVDYLKDGLVIPDPTAMIRCTSVPGHRLAGGDDAPDVLRRDIQQCSVLLAIVSKESLRSPFVLFELGAGWALERRCIPLLARSASFDDLPAFFRDRHALRMRDARDMAGMLREVGKHAKFQMATSGELHQSRLEKLVAAASAD